MSPPPVSKRIGAVSPAIRATPKIIAVIRPLLAAGKTIIATVRHCVPPKAVPASRKSFGIKFRTSSEVRAIVGIIKIVKANAPMNPEYALVIG
ncbi:unannotated protein [freshwater metagenome]|uniref:Unannotated protein n=1 Tax=freshwater metagenome TaxID=449393 RepID=A0A6J6V4Z9_9ZZZZ